MQLQEIYQIAEPVFAWLEQDIGPENIQGVRLAYIQPLVPHFDKLIKFAEDEGNRGRAERLQQDKKRYLEKGQKYFTPDFGWWMHESDFHEGKNAWQGPSKGTLLHKYPNLQILQSRKQAVEAAKKAGQI